MSAQTDEQIADQVYGGVFGNRGDGSPSNTTSGDDAIADKLYGNIKMQNAVQARSQGRQWLGPLAMQQAGNAIQHPYMGRTLEAGLTGMGAVNQGIENPEARGLDAILPGKKASASIPGNAPMEMGDVLASRGAPPWAASAGGFGMAMLGNPLNVARPVGAGVTAAAGAAGNAARQGALKGIATFGAGLMHKPSEAVQYAIDNPQSVFTKENLTNLGGEAQNLGNEMSQKIQGLAKTARGLYQKAGQNASNQMVNPHVPFDVNGTTLIPSLQQRMSSELDQGHLSDILGKTAFTEPSNVNTSTMMTHYIPPQGTGILDATGREITNPGQGFAKGIVSSKEGGNVSKEMQNFTLGPNGEKNIASVGTMNSTTDRPSMQNVSVGEAINRLQSGAPVSVKQLAGVHTALNSVRSATASGMADDVSQVLAQHDPTFKAADDAWRSYKLTSGQNGAKSLFGGISEPDFGSAAPYKAQNAGALINHFDQEPNSLERTSPEVIDRELSKYGPNPNYTDRVKALSASKGFNDWAPHNLYAAGGAVALLPEAAEHIPGMVGAAAAHPAAAAVAKLAGVGLIAGSSKGLNRVLIQALTKKGVLPGGSNRLLQSPAAKYLMNTVNPATMGAGAGMSGMQQQQEQQNSS